MKKLILLLTFILPLAFAFMPAPMPTVSCDAPQNIKETLSTSSSITFNWDAVDGAAGYKVYYVRQIDGYTSPTSSPISTTFTFSNLSSGSYDFYFATDCGSEVSEFLVIEDHIVG